MAFALTTLVRTEGGHTTVRPTLRFWTDYSAEPMIHEVLQYSAIMLSCGPAHSVTSPRLSHRRFLVSGPVPTVRHVLATGNALSARARAPR